MRLLKLLLSGLIILVVGYLVIPNPQFPPPPSNSFTSDEPADTESTYRRAYYTNLTREEIRQHYAENFYLVGQYLLNYPPEEVSTWVREQTPSSFLEELVHPWRESLFIYGYQPTEPKDFIFRDGRQYLNKITVRYVPSPIVTRLTVLGMVVGVGYLLGREYVTT